MGVTRPATKAVRASVRWRWSAGLSVFAVVGAAAVVLSPRSTRASIMIALDLPELVRQAEHIAVVEVGQVNAAWDERHERIYSTIDLKVIESWKFANGTSLPPSTHFTVVQPGGTVGDITMTVTGLGTFVSGERSLIFLRGPSTNMQVVGMSQGKRPLRYESASRRWLVSPADLRQVKLIRPSASPLLKSNQPTPALQSLPQPPVTATTTPALASPAAAAPGSRDLPLDDMRAEVKRLVGAAGAR